MTTTRWYPSVGSNTVPPAPAVAYNPFWFRLPAAGVTDNLSRRVLSTVKLNSSCTGASALKPVPIPNSTAGFQWRTIPFGAGEDAPKTGDFKMVWPTQFIGTSTFYAIIELVAADGTVKSVIGSQSKQTTDSASYYTKTLEGPLTPFDPEIGDFLVVELGFYINSGLGGSAGINCYNTNAGVAPPDYSYEDSLVPVAITAGTPWIEFSLVDQPTNLSARDRKDLAVPSGTLLPHNHEVSPSGLLVPQNHESNIPNTLTPNRL